MFVIVYLDLFVLFCRTKECNTFFLRKGQVKVKSCVAFD
jgi:hypothetical protein